MKFKIKSTGDIVETKISWFFERFIRRELPRQELFFSTLYGFHFNSFSEYWLEIGRKNTLVEIIAKQKKKGIKGISFEEMLQRVSISEFGSGVGVILYNINTYTLGRTLDRFEGVSVGVFNEDYVFIQMDSREQARKLIERTPDTLAEAIAIDRGLIFDRNFEP
jgi:frataxin-like iron-binding protein CyaY